MPSINDTVKVARPLIAKAVADERRQVLIEILRFLDRGADSAQVRKWCEANMVLLDATETAT